MSRYPPICHRGAKRVVRLSLVALLGLALGIGLLTSSFLRSPPGQDTGFAGLGRDAEGFAAARPGRGLRFPEDHGAHPAFRTEWWYLTANLRDEHGQALGVQWTLFRQALAPPAVREETREEASTTIATNPWASSQLWMAHAAVSRGPRHVVAERLASGAPEGLAGPAGVRAEPFSAWIDDWQLTGTAPADADALSQLSVTAKLNDSTGYRLTLSAEGPLVAHGEAGFSQKAVDGQGSYYYSQPFYRVDGQVTLNGATHRVSGRAWLDREWSSQLLGEAQLGWDWLSLHLADGAKLMAFRLRGGEPEGEGEGEGAHDYLSGSFITPDGTVTPLGPDALSLTPLSESAVADRRLPTRWRLEVPGQGLDLTIAAHHPERWMATRVPYWEGAVTVTTPDGQPAGEGYLEMTGY
ncbi:lipocalin-like domain-containing protein [Halomonas sp. YLGW01]|uniref:lipocalin-like domain-containing protein n=1 Tax=Halomonas sp. YLGW01 TaxID=2773308 RepID=UPI001783E97B|nr:lipocalin-like domain-containing protein [Halomonas sp. YLGW01]